MGTKICKDCCFQGAKQWQARLCYRARKSWIDIVDGSIKPNYCSVERSGNWFECRVFGNRCGREGRFWKSKSENFLKKVTEAA